MTAPFDAEIIYHGYLYANGRPVIVMETPDGGQIGPVRHIVRHSPAGLSWGYDGSGPADTARSLLLAALGPEGLCGQCGGTGRVVCDPEEGDAADIAPFDPDRGLDGYRAEGLSVLRCWRYDCEDGYRRVPYQQFKRGVVSGWGWEWRMSRADILAWLQPVR